MISDHHNSSLRNCRFHFLVIFKVWCFTSQEHDDVFIIILHWQVVTDARGFWEFVTDVGCDFLILVSLQTSSELIFGRLAGRCPTVCWRRKTSTLRTVRFKASGAQQEETSANIWSQSGGFVVSIPFLYRFPVFPLTSSTVVTSVVFQVTSSLWVAVFKQRASKKVKAGLLWFFFFVFLFYRGEKSRRDESSHGSGPNEKWRNKQTRTSLFVEAELQRV